MHTHRTTRALGALTLALTLGFALSACGDDRDDTGASTPASTTEHNDADVAFATDMIQHHAQALSMVDLAVDRPLDPDVEALVEQIRSAQGPEIETMVDWLGAWGEEVPETMRDHANSGHGPDDPDDMGESMEGMDDGMPGMMSAEEMTTLADAPDAQFQTRWLEMMVEHHTGAVEMAQDEIDDGRYRPATDLAETIVTSQSEEITTMESLLGS